jgi:hypothetical protein
MASYKPLEFYFDQEFLSMKKHILFTTILSLLLLAVSASAQKATNFAGTWTLDIANSRISDREKAAIEFQSLTVVQSEKDVNVTTTTKRIAPPGAEKGAGPSSAASMPSTISSAFTFDGKETVVSSSGPDGKAMPVKTSSKWEGSKLILTTTRTHGSPEGEITTVQKDTWDLAPDGKLIIRRDNISPQGTSTTARVYTKS